MAHSYLVNMEVFEGTYSISQKRCSMSEMADTDTWMTRDKVLVQTCTQSSFVSKAAGAPRWSGVS